MTPCELWRGACCETIVLPLPNQGPGSGDAAIWMRYHGDPVGRDKVELHCACSKLKDGRCSVYEFRPVICRVYAVGGADCRAAVRARRSNWRDILDAMENDGDQVRPENPKL